MEGEEEEGVKGEGGVIASEQSGTRFVSAHTLVFASPSFLPTRPSTAFSKHSSNQTSQWGGGLGAAV